MRAAVLWLALVLVHGPDGHPIWLVPAEVATVEPFEDAAIGAHTLVKTLAGDRYLAERAEDVVKALKAEACKE